MDNTREKLQQVIIELLNDGKEVEFPVFGISMFPCLLPGFVVRAISLPMSNICRGDIVLFVVNGKLVLHRVVCKGEGWIQCKGDSMFKHDSKLAEGQFVALVIAVKKNGEFKSVSSFPSRVYATVMVAFHRITGWVLWPTALVWQKFVGSR